MELRYRDFKIQPTTYLDKKIRENDYEVVMLQKYKEPIEVISLETGEIFMKDEGYFTVANFKWDKEGFWHFNSCGTRFLEYYTEGLNEFILRAMKLLELSITKEEECDV